MQRVKCELNGAGVELCILENDSEFRQETERVLIGFGFAVRAFDQPRLLYAALLQKSCHLLLLDAGPREEEGMAVIAQLRAISRLGIVILSSRYSTDEHVRGLLGGADACLGKPVDVRLLVATLISVHRRVFSHSNVASANAGRGWELSVDGWFLVAPGGQRISLTPSERPVVRILITQAGRTVARSDLMKTLGEYGDYYVNHRLDVLISRLRQKVRQHADRPLPLKAVRGVGFTFSVD
ncbi:MAG: response regulator transcription factor [Burkholderiales bacterium]|nr:response regulator transcription factor [Burkholderiales bacterium]